MHLSGLQRLEGQAYFFEFFRRAVLSGLVGTEASEQMPPLPRYVGHRGSAPTLGTRKVVTQKAANAALWKTVLVGTMP